MSTKELERLEVVRRVAEGRLTQAKAGEFIGLSEHQVRRLRVAFESARRSTRGTASNPPSAAAGQVVKLNAGTLTVSSTISLRSGVVLRGAGSQGVPAGTTIVKTGGGTVLAIGTARDSACYGGTGFALTQDGMLDSKTISVGPRPRASPPGISPSSMWSTTAPSSSEIAPTSSASPGGRPASASPSGARPIPAGPSRHRSSTSRSPPGGRPAPSGRGWARTSPRWWESFPPSSARTACPEGYVLSG